MKDFATKRPFGTANAAFSARSAAGDSSNTANNVVIIADTAIAVSVFVLSLALIRLLGIIEIAIIILGFGIVLHRKKEYQTGNLRASA